MIFPPPPNYAGVGPSHKTPIKHLEVCGCNVWKYWNVYGPWILLQGSVEVSSDLMRTSPFQKKLEAELARKPLSPLSNSQFSKCRRKTPTETRWQRSTSYRRAQRCVWDKWESVTWNKASLDHIFICPPTLIKLGYNRLSCEGTEKKRMWGF